MLTEEASGVPVRGALRVLYLQAGSLSALLTEEASGVPVRGALRL